MELPKEPPKELPKEPPKQPRATAGWHVRWQDVVVLAVAGLVLWGGLKWWLSPSLHQEVWFLNGLDVPVTVELGERQVLLAGGGKSIVTVPVGVHPVRVRLASNEVLEERLVAIPTGRDLVVYSVLGAAPTFLQKIVYTRKESGGKGDNSMEVYAGERFTVHDDIDYEFDTPPASLTVDSNSSTLVRRRFDVDPGGWKTTVSYLLSRGQAARAAELCRDVARANPANPTAQDYAEALTVRSDGIDAAVVLARGRLERQPESVDAHRRFAHLMRWAGRKDELRAYYEERVRAAPGSALLQAMLSRTEPPELARTQLTALVARHPDQPFVRRSAAWASYTSGHLAEAEALFAGLPKEDPEYRYAAEDHARILAALHRGKEGVALLRKILDAPGQPDWSLVILYAQLVRQPGMGAAAESVEAYIKRLGDGHDGTSTGLWLATLLGTQVDPLALEPMQQQYLRTAAQIQIAAGQDPAAAWKACAGAPTLALQSLAPEVAVLLGAEFDRAGDAALAATLYEASGALSLPTAIISEYVHGGQKHPDLEWIDPIHLAALDLARARTFDALGKPSTALYAAIEKNDVLQGIVTRARRAWPAVGRSSAQGHEVVLTRP